MLLDIIGDIHGELPALRALLAELGYDGQCNHPQNRTLVFVGDLIDRGNYSFETAQLVMELVQRGRAMCLMGNHEYNIVAWALNVPGYARPKHSNRPTIAAIQADRARWDPILTFFRDLPIAINLPGVRVIHACWHKQSLDLVAPALAVKDDIIALRSPFDANGLRTDLPNAFAEEDCPHEQLMKGFEVPTDTPFLDNDGHERHRIRAVWWRDQRDLVLCDKLSVFGHYWNLPPIDGNFAPPYPSGHPELRAWARDLAARCPPSGSVPLTGDYACIDFNGYTKASGKDACVGALRLPEREIVWAVAPREASQFDRQV